MATHTHHQTDYRDRPGEHTTAHDGRSLGELIKDLRDQTTTLVRDEVKLAKTEMSEKVSKLSRNGGYLAAGALVAFSGLIVLLLAASAGLYIGLVAAGLSHSMAGWVAPLAVGLVVIAIGYGLMQKAISTFRKEPLVPQRTVETVRDDAEWMKRKVK